jgi:hypothetical protein
VSTHDLNTLIVWGWASAIFGLPLVLLAGLVAAVAGRGSVRMQLLIMAAIPVALYVAITGGVGH